MTLDRPQNDATAPRVYDKMAIPAALPFWWSSIAKLARTQGNGSIDSDVFRQTISAALIRLSAVRRVGIVWIAWDALKNP